MNAKKTKSRKQEDHPELSQAKDFVLDLLRKHARTRFSPEEEIAGNRAPQLLKACATVTLGGEELLGLLSAIHEGSAREQFQRERGNRLCEDRNRLLESAQERDALCARLASELADMRFSLHAARILAEDREQKEGRRFPINGISPVTHEQGHNRAAVLADLDKKKGGDL